MPAISYSLIILSSLAGFFLAVYIFRKKRTKKPLVCPLNSDCQAVVNSSFSTFFSIPLEVWGILYYLTTVTGYSFFIIAGPISAYPTPAFMLLSLTTFAFVFSLYLTFIQAFLIHEWCIWCLTSAALSSVIFLTTIFGADYSIVEVLTKHFQVILTVSVSAFALGLGSATFYGLFFIKFLKDLKISQLEQDILRTISQVSWLSIFLMVISSLGLFPQIDNLANIDIFLISLTILAVIILNELIITLIAGPRLMDISLGLKHPHHPGELRRLRQSLLIVSVVSLISWYTLLVILLLPKNLMTPLSTFFAIYIGLAAAGFLIGFIADQIMSRSAE